MEKGEETEDEIADGWGKWRQRNEAEEQERQEQGQDLDDDDDDDDDDCGKGDKLMIIMMMTEGKKDSYNNKYYRGLNRDDFNDGDYRYQLKTK